VENAVHYNTQLFQNKASRLPYLDAQTGIAQTVSPLLRNRLERRRGPLQGQIFSYSSRRWRREPQPKPKVVPGGQKLMRIAVEGPAELSTLD